MTTDGSVGERITREGLSVPTASSMDSTIAPLTVRAAMVRQMAMEAWMGTMGLGGRVLTAMERLKRMVAGVGMVTRSGIVVTRTSTHRVVVPAVKRVTVIFYTQFHFVLSEKADYFLTLSRSRDIDTSDVKTSRTRLWSSRLKFIFAVAPS